MMMAIGGCDPQCECDIEQHYLPCKCGSCDCTVIPYGYLTTDAERIPVFMTNGVTEAQAAAFIQNLTTAYGTLKITLSDKYAIIDAKVKRIVITADGNTSKYNYSYGGYVVQLKPENNVTDLLTILAAWLTNGTTFEASGQ
jgi:hypothetical protein